MTTTAPQWTRSPLGKLVRDSGHTPTTLARALDLSEIATWQLLAGRRNPSLALILAIWAEIGGDGSDLLSAAKKGWVASTRKH